MRHEPGVSVALGLPVSVASPPSSATAVKARMNALLWSGFILTLSAGGASYISGAFGISMVTADTFASAFFAAKAGCLEVDRRLWPLRHRQ